MNEDTLKGKWKQMKGDIQKKWGKLTNDDLDRIEGSREKMIGTLQERYGYKKEQAKKELDAYLEAQSHSHV